MKKIALIGLALALPMVTFAQQSVDTVEDVGSLIINLINNVAVPVIFALAFLLFIWGVFKFFFNAGNPDGRKEGLSFMLYGVLGFVIMISVWGLVNLLVGSVDLENEGPAEIPQTPSLGR